MIISVRLLMVEDEEVLAATVAKGLRREGIAVDLAHDGATGLRLAMINRYDVVILDRDLPVMHGDEVCRELVKERPDTRIVMLTASADLDNRVEGLSIGADDYLGKPFAFAELLARVRALGRRALPSRPPVLSKDDLTLDSATRVVMRAGKYIPLTKKELAVLEVLLEADGAVVSAETLLDRAWDEHADPFTNTIRVTVMKLRKKLGNPPLIETITGTGYRI